MRIPGSDLIFFHFYIAIFRFLLLDIPFLQKRATTKMWLESSVFDLCSLLQFTKDCLPNDIKHGLRFTASSCSEKYQIAF